MKSRFLLYIVLISSRLPYFFLMAVLFFSVFKYIYITFDIDRPEFFSLNPNFSKFYDLNLFIKQRKPITIESIQYFILKNKTELLEKYKKIKPNRHNISYHEILPFHSNGISKREINYHDFFKYQNIVIKHFTSYLNNSDKNSDNRNFYLIRPSETNHTILTNNQITLVYLFTVSKPSDFLIREIKAMSHPRIAFILFLDNKMNRRIFYKLFESVKNNEHFSNVYFVDSPRFHVHWALITQTMAQLITIQACLKYFPNSLYLSCHSDSDYPIKSAKYILKFLKKNYPRNFLYSIPKSKEMWKKDRKDLFYLFNGDDKKVTPMLRKLFPKKVTPRFKWRTGWNWLTVVKKMVMLLAIVFFNFCFIKTKS